MRAASTARRSRRGRAALAFVISWLALGTAPAIAQAWPRMVPSTVSSSMDELTASLTAASARRRSSASLSSKVRSATRCSNVL